jgi:hypothetical protein
MRFIMAMLRPLSADKPISLLFVNSSASPINRLDSRDVGPLQFFLKMPFFIRN